MQRITWSGVAMHAGVLPGHPASHGLHPHAPTIFAVRLYGLTAARAPRVIITRNEIAPVAFEHSRLVPAVPSSPSTASASLTRARPYPRSRVRRSRPRKRQSPDDDVRMRAIPKTPGRVFFKPRVEANAAGPQQDAEPPVAATRRCREKEPLQTNAQDNTQAATQESAQEPARAVRPARQPPRDRRCARRQTASAELRGAGGTWPAAADAAAVPDDAAQGARPRITPRKNPEEGRQRREKTLCRSAPVLAAQPATAGAHSREPPRRPFEAGDRHRDGEVRRSVTPAANRSRWPKTFEQASAPKPESAPRALEPVIAPPKVQSAVRPPSAPSGRCGPARSRSLSARRKARSSSARGFQPVFSAARHGRPGPSLPLGTHLFTASEALPDGVSLPLGSSLSLSGRNPPGGPRRSAKPEAPGGRHVQKDRPRPPVTRTGERRRGAQIGFEIPGPPRWRAISALMSAGRQPLIISDQGLGPETGKRKPTSIVLTR